MKKYFALIILLVSAIFPLTAQDTLKNHKIAGFEAFLKTLSQVEQSIGEAVNYFRRHFDPGDGYTNDRAFLKFEDFAQPSEADYQCSAL